MFKAGLELVSTTHGTSFETFLPTSILMIFDKPYSTMIDCTSTQTATNDPLIYIFARLDG